MTAIRFEVAGLPQPQGNHRTSPSGHTYDTNPKLRPWRDAVVWNARQAADAARWTKATGPVMLWVTFYMPRPKGHFGSGRHQDRLRPSAPALPITKPDASKMLRAVEDALTDAGIWRDDSQVVWVRAEKRYGPPGVSVVVAPTDELAEPEMPEPVDLGAAHRVLTEGLEEVAR